jgi:2-polyprenyl-6-methoxyphenol hydroxylase-like FAD-dependent oxidoreductase
MKILISGASVAGPALAHWLGHAGHDVTVVERAPSLRAGGYAVDFRGPAHLGTLEKMGILDELRRLETGGGAMRFIDPRGRTRLFLPAEFAGGDLEVRRADISRVLHERRAASVQYIFGDSVRALTQHATHVDVAFDHMAPQRFDFVFGADGIHSNIRRLAIPGQQFERDLGHYIASWDVPALAVAHSETVCLNVPGRMIGIQPPGRAGVPAGVLAMFAAGSRKIDRRDVGEQKRVLRALYSGLGWRTEELLDALERTDEVFFNTISRAKVPQWSVGRVALLGDAAGGCSIGGMGTGSAIVGAYVLAGELLADPADFAGAFSRYQALMFPYADPSATNGETSGKFLAPASALSLFLRDAMFSFPPIKRWMIAEAQKTGTAIALPDYGLSNGAADA